MSKPHFALHALAYQTMNMTYLALFANLHNYQGFKKPLAVGYGSATITPTPNGPPITPIGWSAAAATPPIKVGWLSPAVPPKYPPIVPPMRPPVMKMIPGIPPAIIPNAPNPAIPKATTPTPATPAPNPARPPSTIPPNHPELYHDCPAPPAGAAGATARAPLNACCAAA